MQKTQKKRLQVAVIGKGRLGTSLARALDNVSGFGLYAHLAAQSGTFKRLADKGGPDIIFIVTRDTHVAHTAKKALHDAGSNGRLIVHCAGSLAPDILPRKSGVMRATFHPIQTFAKPNSQLFRGIAIGIASDDARAIRLLTRFAKGLGATQIIKLQPDILPLYHSMIVYGANFVKLLGTALEEIAKQTGIREKEMKAAMRPILRQALEDILQHNSHEVLTGPISRGDTATIERHRKALTALPREVLALYDSFLALARRFGLWNMKM